MSYRSPILNDDANEPLPDPCSEVVLFLSPNHIHHDTQFANIDPSSIPRLSLSIVCDMLPCYLLELISSTQTFRLTVLPDGDRHANYARIYNVHQCTVICIDRHFEAHHIVVQGSPSRWWQCLLALLPRSHPPQSPACVRVARKARGRRDAQTCISACISPRRDFRQT